MAKIKSKGLNSLSNKFPNLNSAALKESIFVELCTLEILGSFIDRMSDFGKFKVGVSNLLM
jgi:hypothetical protein